MEKRENFPYPPDVRAMRTDSRELGVDAWFDGSILEGPRRTYFILLERLEQSRELLRDMSARLRRPQ
jgi:hypothetical protein